jgi:anti-sigma regulatory factor (Ser/Thr protein kinase)
MHLLLALNLPAEERLVPAARSAIAGFLLAAGVGEDTVDDIVLALNEACSNVLQHAFPIGHPGSYELRADFRPEEIVIEVSDQGVGFDAMDLRSSGILDLNGRGLDIMRRVMTSVEVESPRQGGGTRLRLRNRLVAFNG